MLTMDELRADVDAGLIDTVVMAITDMQGRLQGKRLDAGAFVREIAEHGAEGCHYLLAVDIDMNTLPGFEMSGWDSGYGDFVFRPDLATLRRCTWLEGTVMVQADMEWHDGTPVAQAPRSILKAQLARLAERGWTAKIGSELEFILFRETYEASRAKGYRDLVPANEYNVDYSDLRHHDRRGRDPPDPPAHGRTPAWWSRTRRASATSASTRSTSGTPTR